jgi:hypothetical protein
MYRPAASKNFRAAVEHLLRTEFPRFGGPKVMGLFLDELMALMESHHLTQDRVGVGQVLWYAVHKDDQPYRYKKITDCKMVPVVLSLVTPEDVSRRRQGGEGRRERTKRVVARLYREAYEQDGVLSVADLSLLLGCSPIYLSQLTRDYEAEYDVLLPRRGTIHDMGPTVSHKAIICRKAIVDGKQTPDIARETFHHERSVDNYLLSLDRVAVAMLKHSMSAQETCFTTGMSEGLVRQYMDLIKQLGLSEDDLPLRDGRVQVLPAASGDPNI